MSDNTMPERIIAGYGFHGYEWSLPESVMAYRLESVTEYIRANIAQAQLAERENAVQREVYVERMRADGLRRQLDAANARIAELEAALSLESDVVAAQKARLMELQRHIAQLEREC